MSSARIPEIVLWEIGFQFGQVVSACDDTKYPRAELIPRPITPNSSLPFRQRPTLSNPCFS